MESSLIRVSLDPWALHSIKIHAVSSSAEDGPPYHTEIWPGEFLNVAMYGKRELRIERGSDVKSA